MARVRKQVRLAGFEWPWEEKKKPMKTFDVGRKLRSRKAERVAKMEAGVKVAQERLQEYFKVRSLWLLYLLIHSFV